MTTPNKFDFARLLDSSQKLVTHIDNGELPHMQRGVEQIDAMSKRLLRKTERTEDFSRNKANALLAQRGLDTERMSRALQGIDLTSSFEPFEDIGYTDIQGYLRHEHELIILSAIEEAKKETINDFDINYNDHMQRCWKASKDELMKQISSTSGAYNRGGISGGQQRYGQFQQQQQQQSMSMVGHSEVHPMVDAFLQVVKAINDNSYRHISDQTLLVATEFQGVSRQFADSRPLQRQTEINDSWEMLRYLVGEVDAKNRKVSALRNQWEARGRGSSEMEVKKIERTFINSALVFLETQCWKVIRAYVENNRAMAQTGGEVGVQSDIKAFIRLKFPKSEVPNSQGKDYSVWAVLFYCLRCGQVDTASVVAENAGERDVVPLLREFSENRQLSTTARDKASKLLNQIASSTPRDPFKYAVYRVLSQQAETHNQIDAGCYPTVQDYLWVNLSMIRDPTTSPSTMPFSSFTLEELQEKVRKTAPRTFQNKPVVMFQVLLSVQLFEEAIVSLYESTDFFKVDAVHFAICLSYYGILRLRTDHSQDTVSEPPAISLDALVSQYLVSYVPPAKVDLHFHYALLREDGLGKREELKNLLLQTRKFNDFLGYSGQTGLFGSYLGVEETNRIINMAAESAERSGDPSTAVGLWERCSKHVRAIQILNTELQGMLPDSLDKSFVEFVERKKQEYHSRTELCQTPEYRTFLTMFDLVKFFDLYHRGLGPDAQQDVYQTCLNHVRLMGILPISDSREGDNNLDEVQQCRDQFLLLDQSVRSLFPDVLWATAVTLRALYERVKEDAHHNYPGVSTGSDTQMLEELRRKADRMLYFIGMLPMKLQLDNIHRELVKVSQR